MPQQQLEQELHHRTWERISIEEPLYKRIEQCRTAEAIRNAIVDGFKPFQAALTKPLTDEDIDHLLPLRIRRISLFDMEQHRQEMETARTELAQVRRNLKNLTAYAIAHPESLLERYGPQVTRRTTQSARHTEVDTRAVVLKAFTVSYDRESEHLGYKVAADEFKCECTCYDRMLLVFRDGTYKLVELPEKLSVGSDLVWCGPPDRARVFTCVYTDRRATYIKRFVFGGMILNKLYSLLSDKGRIL